MDFMAVNGSPKPAKGETNGAKKSNAGKKQPTGDSVTRKKFMQVCLAFQSFKKDGKVDFEELARETGSASVASAGVRFGQIMRQFNEEFAEGKYDDVRQPSRVKRAADAAASAGNNVSGAKVVTGDEPVPKKARRTKKDAVETKEAMDDSVKVKEEPELRAIATKALNGDGDL